MADTYYQTATSVGAVDDPANVPPGATIINQAQYDAAIAAWQTTVDNSQAAELASAEARYNRVYLALRSMGMPVAAAQDVAKTASGGVVPAADPEVNVKAMTQLSVMSANRTLTAASGTWEQITELPSLTVQESGLYRLDWAAQGQLTMPAGAFTGTTKVGVFKAAVIIPNTETKLVGGVGSAAGAAIGMLTAGSGSIPVSLNVGDVISMYGQRVFSAAGSTHIIYSDVDGRTRLSLERIRPA